MNGRTNSAGGALVSDIEIPLDPCTDFVGVRIKDLEYLGKVRLTWTDPKDKYATPEGEAMEDTDQLVSKWSYTQIVRQADRAPVNPSDGVTVCTETTRNQYQTTGFVDTTAESNVTYYYGAYAFNEDGVYSEVISNGVQPVSFSTTLADNTWEEIDQACTLGVAPSVWEIGDEKTFGNIVATSDPTIYTAVIIDFNHDDLSDGTSKAAITFCTKEAIGHVDNTNSDNWTNSNSGLNMYLKKWYNEMDSDLKTLIKTVKKITVHVSPNSGEYRCSHRTDNSLPLFPFGLLETAFDFSDPIEDQLADGNLYPYFSTKANRDKNYEWWLRATRSTVDTNGDGIYTIDENGNHSAKSTARINGYYQYAGICFGFCIGKVAV